jgi:aminoglycoside phosphotransferase (APT) family kinase protein
MPSSRSTPQRSSKAWRTGWWRCTRASGSEASGEHPELARSTGTVTRASQAWPPAAIAAHARTLRAEASSFLREQAAELTSADTALLEEVLAWWEARFVERAAAGQAITLLHGDFHLLGNIFFAPDLPLPRIIDWSEIKPGLGPHDLAYALLSAPSSHRVARDLAMLRYYHESLLASGVRAYSWELCHWDYRFSLLTNLFQSVFQRSAFWFRKTAAVAAEHDALAALRSPPPAS